MRKSLRFLGFGLLCIFSVDTLIAILDWIARWDMLKQLFSAHPLLDKFLHTPLVYIVLLLGGFALLAVEQRLKRPRLLVKFVNSRIQPNLHRMTMRDFFEACDKKPGWDERPLDAWWFVELHVVNDSDIPTKLEDVEVCVRAGKRGRLEVTPYPDMGQFRADMGYDENLKDKRYENPRYRDLPDLRKDTTNVPLTRGIGHRGWLRFGVKGITQKDIDASRLNIDIWLIDSLHEKHKAEYKKNSDKKWDKGFVIFEDSA